MVWLLVCSGLALWHYASVPSYSLHSHSHLHSLITLTHYTHSLHSTYYLLHSPYTHSPRTHHMLEYPEYHPRVPYKVALYIYHNKLFSNITYTYYRISDLIWLPAHTRTHTSRGISQYHNTHHSPSSPPSPSKGPLYSNTTTDYNRTIQNLLSRLPTRAYP